MAQQEEVYKDDDNYSEEDELEARRERRRDEWGLQFDLWLIRLAGSNRKGVSRPVELLLSHAYPGITKENNLIDGVPLRVDKYFILMKVDSQEIWVNKDYIIGCKAVIASAIFENDSPASEEVQGD